jgi:PAS domain S-box-containing protein
MPTTNELRLQGFDWAKSPLGEQSAWPVEMKAAISIMMASGFPMCTVWGDRRIQIYNDAYNEIYGAKHPASFGAPAEESWSEIREFLGPALDRVMSTGETLRSGGTLLPLVRSTMPEECYFDFSFSPIRREDGTIAGLLSVVAERTSEVILRRRQRLAELDPARDADEPFDVVMNTLHNLLAANEMDCAMAVLYSVAAETGAPDGEIWSLRASRNFTRTMRPLAARALRRGSVGLDETGATDDEPAQVICIPIYTLDGAPCCALVISPNALVPLETSALPFAQAISTRFHAVLHAGERRRREIGQMRDQIAEHEVLYTFLFNNIQDGVAYCATSGAPTDDEVIIAVNPRLCELVGYTADELIGMSRDAVFFQQDALLLAALEKRGRERQFTGELQLRGKNGRKVPVELTSNLIEFSRGQTRSLTILRDISHRREVEEQQAERVRLETVANLAGSLAHDTNNLMTIVIGSAEFLADILPAGGRERQMARNAMIAAERASGLTNQLLVYARQHPLAARPVDLNAFLEEIRPLVASALGEINTLAVKCEPDLPPCMADPAQLTTAILNLVTNARHAMPDGGTLLLESFLQTAEARGDGEDPSLRPYVGLRVKDTGTGIPEEIQGRVFEPFFTTKEVGSGSGLGLSIVQRLIDDLGGTLRLSSSVGQGTVFELCFQPADAVTWVDDKEELEGRADGETVLYVEDNEIVRQQTETMLRLIGVDPIAFGSGREALEWITKGGHADLLLTDLVLPGGMSGLDLAVSARRHQPGLSVIITTGYDPRAALSKERNRHFPVLRKPYTRRSLAAVLLQELRRP